MKNIVCPRCRGNMQLVIQSENRGRTTTITYMYTCVVCRYKEVLEVIEVKPNGSRIELSITKYVRA